MMILQAGNAAAAKTEDGSPETETADEDRINQSER